MGNFTRNFKRALRAWLHPSEDTPAWLSEVADSRVGEQLTLEQRLRARNDALERERKRVDRFVKALLKRIGKAYWGSLGEDYRVSTITYNSGYGWKVGRPRGEGYAEWTVDLHFADNGNVTFLVYAKDFSEQTKDTSEASLEAALRSAVAAGPKYRWSGG